MGASNLMVGVTDLRECNEKIATNNNQIVQVKEHLAILTTDIKWIRKALEGNGKTGLIEEVKENTKFRWFNAGVLKVLGVIMGAVICVITGIIIKIY